MRTNGAKTEINDLKNGIVKLNEKVWNMKQNIIIMIFGNIIPSDLLVIIFILEKLG